MANRSKRLEGNAPGDFFVDDTCIDCGACRWICPEVFGRDGEYAIVAEQPADGRVRRALTAIIACPVGAIGAGPKHDLKGAINGLPETVPGSTPADGVHYVGFHSEKSFGAASWLIVRPSGNVLVDSPRLNPGLLKRLQALGGVRYLFLTHRDDVAEHERLAEHFGLTRILHRKDITSATAGVEMPIDGTDPIPLGDDLLIVPTPGHTAGSACLLYKNYLFTGDHLAFGPGAKHLIAFDRHCWDHWPTQIDSMERLKGYPFEWVLPGHGAPGHLPMAQMAQAMDTLSDWMRSR
jgi:glyoxylase-like metal-dependent hydrolase (beta-lactamase superfamily II)/ferredoxin